MKIGHAHIKVRDLKRSEKFYSSIFGLKVTERLAGRFVFMTGTSMHHEIALQQVPQNARLPGPSDVGLFHVAFEVPDKQSLANAHQRLVQEKIQLSMVDHRISWAIYFSDPDNNGLEIYCDMRTQNDTDQWQGHDRSLSAMQLELILESFNRPYNKN